ncbi:MAG: AAA family ATPase, partial [Methylococcales bacterium]|nr:AAA family ATPase [Methylococcales bacterium]
MKITSLSLFNFKSIGPEQQTVIFKPITLLFGPNSAGKSTVVQALHYVYEILERNNTDPGKTLIGGQMDLGGFQNLVHQHNIRQPISLAIEFEVDELPDYGDGEEANFIGIMLSPSVKDLSQVKTIKLSIDIRWSEIENKAYVAKYSVAINGEHFADIVAKADLKNTVLTNINYTHPFIGSDNSSIFEDYFNQYLATGNATEIGTYFKHGALPDFGEKLPLEFYNLEHGFAGQNEQHQIGSGELSGIHSESSSIKTYFSRIMVGSGECLRDYLRKYLYIGPLRVVPKR